MKKTFVSFLISAFLIPTYARSQVVVSLGMYDIGKIHPIKVSPNQDLTIIFEELIPVLTNYEVTFSSKTEEIEHLSLINPFTDTDCSNNVGKLKNAKSEKEVRQLLNSWPIGCTNPLVNQTKKPFLPANLEILSPFGRASLRYGETLIIFVKRQENSDKNIPEASWTFELSPGSQGKWQFSYGANFFNLMNRDEEYYLDQSQHIQKVEKEYWQSIVKPMAGIFITFFPTHKLARKTFVGFSAGYTTNFQSNNFFAGASVVVRQNVLLHANLGIRQVTRLKGKYIKNFTNSVAISTGIEGKDLVEDNFMPDIAIGISFRFKDNPFGTNNNTP